MSDPFIGEIQLFGFNFAPRGWAFCQGQSLPISQNTALFSLLGVQFGGDGQTLFNLPDFRGAAACATGHGAGLSGRHVGESFGEATVTLIDGQMPAHTHSLQIYNQNAPDKTRGKPSSNDAVTSPLNTRAFTGDAAVNTGFALGTVSSSGGTQPHDNQQPYLALNFCIALQGIYPSRP